MDFLSYNMVPEIILKAGCLESLKSIIFRLLIYFNLILILNRSLIPFRELKGES